MKTAQVQGEGGKASVGVALTLESAMRVQIGSATWRVWRHSSATPIEFARSGLRPCFLKHLRLSLRGTSSAERATRGGNTMHARMTKVAGAFRQSKFLVAPALIIGGWLALFGAVAIEMSRPPLKASIEKVLSARATRADFLARR